MPDSPQLLVDAVISVSATLPATYDVTGYDAVATTDIEGVTDYTPGESTVNVTSTQPINSRTPVKYKGTRNPGSDTITMERDDDDAGQVILLAALSSDNAHTFKVTYGDGSIDYFTGYVSSFTTGAGAADSMVTRVATIDRVTETVTKASA